MSMKSKTELKDVFNGTSSLMYQSAVVDLGSSSPLALAPEYDLPVTVDTLQLTQEDPTINHYKVIGLDGDWTSSATVGNMTIQLTVPTKNSDMLTLFYGSSSVKTITGATITTGNAELDGAAGSPNTYGGTAVKLKGHKITGTFVIVDDEYKNLFVVTNIAMWAEPLYENASSQPFAFKLTGTIEGAGDYSMAWLKREEPAQNGGGGH